MNSSSPQDSRPTPEQQWAAVPDELKAEKAWLLWEKVPKPKKPGQFDKRPFYEDGTPRRGIQGSEADRAKLVTFAKIVKAYAKNGDRFAGIGKATLKGSPSAALDLDGVDTHEGARELARIAEACGAYIERSPSGKGLRVFIKRTGLGSGAVNEAGHTGFQLFEDSGFVTVTGDVVHPGGVVDFSDIGIAKLKQAFGSRKSRAINSDPPPDWSKFDLGSLTPSLKEEVLRGYTEDDNRSDRLFGFCIKLARSGYEIADAFNILADPDLPWLAPGIERRNGDIEGGQYWLWEHTIKKVYALEQQRSDDRRDALRVGQGDEVEPKPFPILTVDEMLGRFVSLDVTDEVCDLERPWLAMSMAHFKSLTAACRTLVGVSKKPTASALIWHTSPERVHIDTRTWRPGVGRYLHNPNGLSAVNIWAPRQAGEAPGDWQKLAQPFTDHVTFLVPVESERKRFLDWLAHMEQQPGELTHSHYLMIAPNAQGIGRNWLSTMLANVWSGNVALSVDLADIAGGGFNDSLSQKFLAIVDELCEGDGSGSKYALYTSLKSVLAQPIRKINPKYGKQHLEFNCLRWLMFSNDIMAIPIVSDDRRIWAIENPTVARRTDYYAMLYGLLKRPEVSRSVLELLRTRNIEDFKPGERPVMNAIKAEMVEATKSDGDRALADVVNSWPAEVIYSTDLQRLVFGDVITEGRDKRAVQMRHMLSRIRAKNVRVVKVNGVPMNVIALRNTEKWDGATLDEIRAELAKARRV